MFQLIYTKNIKISVTRYFQTNFLPLLQDDKYSKLRTYKLFKYKLEYKNYLWFNMPKYRVSLCRLRTSSHHLEIDRWRYI